MLRVKDQLNASTEHVLNETLSRVITLDGISAPDALPFHIPVAWIPASMYKKAFLIIDSAERTILCRVIATGCAVAPASPVACTQRSYPSCLGLGGVECGTGAA